MIRRGIRRAMMRVKSWWASPSSLRHAARLLTLLLVLVLPMSLAACAPGGFGGSRYLPANAAIDPYANMRRKAEELYQAGLGQARRNEWRQALQSFEQAHQWDPDNRADITGELDHARQEARALAFAAPPPTPTLQPVLPKAGGAAPTVPAATVPTPGGVQTPPPATPTPTSAAVPKVGFRSFRSMIYPYTVSYPSTWTAKGDASSKGQDHIDMFLAPAGTTQAFVMIQAQQLRLDVTIDQFLTLVENQLVTDAGGTVQNVEARKVGGAFAYVITYRLQSNGAYLAVHHALFLDGNRGWSIALMATPGTTPDLVKVFDAMLESFALQNDPSRVQ